MKHLFLLTSAVAALAAAPAAAFNFQVSGIEKVPVAAQDGVETYHPVFTPDGRSLIVTSEAYDGLGIVDLEKGTARRLSSRTGAGYRFALNPEGTQVVLRENDLENQKMALYTLDLETAAEKCIEPQVEHTNTLRLNTGVAVYAEPLSRTLRVWADPAVASVQAVSDAMNDVLLTEEDLKLVVYRDGTRTVVDPIMDATGQDVNYCWSSISPDGQRMVFAAHNLTYTSRLDGTDLVCLGQVQAPVWYDNNTVVGMNDKDDGHMFISSDIIAVDTATAQVMQLTPETDDIKMFPSVSPDGSRIAYHTTDGELYIINLIKK